ncbi:MAG: radical SAM protein [Desulfovibrio sp.]|nr:radical SAM protein [Desulfovibrio sp.]
MTQADHPCFNASVRSRFGRVHLPVAGDCNLSCGYCNRRYACVNESRPGVTQKLLRPEEACEALAKVLSSMPQIRVAAIAGPGDPLASAPATLQTLQMVKKRFPSLLLCLSTNGLALPEYCNELVELGVSHVTVTVNTLQDKNAASIYQSIQVADSPLQGAMAAQLLRERQEEGVRRLSEQKVTVKINTVVLPSLNDREIPHIAQTVAGWGAKIMNLIGLIPVAGTPLAHLPAPSSSELAKLRTEAQRFLPQMTHCSRCRADAVGLLGEKHILQPFLHRPPSSCVSSPA